MAKCTHKGWKYLWKKIRDKVNPSRINGQVWKCYKCKRYVTAPRG